MPRKNHRGDSQAKSSHASCVFCWQCFMPMVLPLWHWLVTACLGRALKAIKVRPASAAKALACGALYVSIHFEIGGQDFDGAVRARKRPRNGLVLQCFEPVLFTMAGRAQNTEQGDVLVDVV